MFELHIATENWNRSWLHSIRMCEPILLCSVFRRHSLEIRAILWTHKKERDGVISSRIFFSAFRSKLLCLHMICLLGVFKRVRQPTKKKNGYNGRISFWECWHRERLTFAWIIKSCEHKLIPEYILLFVCALFAAYHTSITTLGNSIELVNGPFCKFIWFAESVLVSTPSSSFWHLEILRICTTTSDHK